MKAIRIHEDGGPEVLRYEDAPDPEPGEGEVLIRLRAASLNRLDLWVRRGLPSVPKPRILGADGAGVVEALGARRQRLRARRAGRDQPGRRARVEDHGHRRAHRRHARRADRRPGRERLSARGRARLRGGGRVPARLRDRLPDARHEGRARGGRVGARVGRRQRHRQRVARAGEGARRAGRSRPRRRRRSWCGRPSWAQTSSSTTRRATFPPRSRRRPAPAWTSSSSTSARRRGSARCSAHDRKDASSCAGRRAGPTRRPRCTASGGSSWPCSARRWGRARTSRASTSWFARDALKPVVDSVFPLEDAAAAHERMERGEHFGKIVLSIPG